MNPYKTNNMINMTGKQESMKFAMGNFIMVFILFVMLYTTSYFR